MTKEEQTTSTVLDKGSGKGVESEVAGSEKTGSQANEAKELSPMLQEKLGCKTADEAILKLIEQNAKLAAQNEAAQAEIGRQSTEIGESRQAQQQVRPQFTDEQREYFAKKVEEGDVLGVVDEITTAKIMGDQNIERRCLDAYMQGRNSSPKFANIDQSEFNWQASKLGMIPSLIVDVSQAKMVMQKIVDSRPVDLDAIRADERQKTIDQLKSDEKQREAAGLTLASNAGAGEPESEDLTKPLTPEESEEKDMIALAISQNKFTLATVINQIGNVKAKRYGLIQ